MINKDRLINKFFEYIKVDSETGNEGKICELLIKEMKSIGMEVFTDNAGEKANSNGNNIYAYIKGDMDIEPILLSSHMDTVRPGIGIKPIIKDGIISSESDTILGSDDKSGIAAILEALTTIKEKSLSHGPIELVFTICEESGMLGSKNLDYSKIRSKKGFVFDSSGSVGKIIIQAPSQDKISAKIIGRSAHAGVAPQEGISAIQVAAEAITNMKLLRVDSDTTANIGIVKGGTATNIVCPEIEVFGEARSLDDKKLYVQSNHMIKCLKDACDKYDAKLEYTIENVYRAFKIDNNDEIVKMIGRICNKIGIKSNPTTTGGGSDANIYNQNGIKSINLGTGMEKAHTISENISVESLTNISKVALEIMLRQE